MLNKENISALSNTAIVQNLGLQFRTYRLNARLTQKEVAQRAGISMLTLRAFEQGKATNITMGTFLALLRIVGQLPAVADLLPEIPISPYALSKLNASIPNVSDMENNLLSVWLWWHEVGRLYWDNKQQRSVFAYSPDFLHGNIDITLSRWNAYASQAAVSESYASRIAQHIHSLINDAL